MEDNIARLYDSILGVDESGKGDLFGPLVVAGVYVEDEKKASILLAHGIRDSKTLSDAQALRLAPIINNYCKTVIVKIGVTRYNELYEKIQNLNRMLGWGHARVIENCLKDVSPKYIVSDKFGDESVIKVALMEKGKKSNLIQKTKAEQNVAVAAASIIARAEFLKSMQKMTEEYAIEFPKGGGNPKIDLALERFVKKYGKDKLNHVAKMHFKNLKKYNEREAFKKILK
ncbi:MAG TPA: ribonuclease HIII [Alphaproteobacteria bacterium]|nr:ribonuclease HIII [Alphaproteobacteria bacterium]